ncbi:MAG TPA: type IX secretion system membrane protein PorP/SprF [Chitinophagaceae bacterium]|jgi:type IX secretion system PorP/SprF family membrane protein|nr:type IX secretion system membrane protein PorP/SprF [Chitinophagaceae bacterium]
MKKNFLIILLLCVMTIGKAQQLQTSSLYDMQGVLHNPAMAGMMMKGMIGVSYRNQWTGVSGSPKTATLFGSFALPEHKIGLGGYIYNDQTGPTSRTGVQFAFAKHIPMKNDATLSLGIEAKGLQYSIDVDKLQQTLGTDPVLGSGDNKFKFDAGFGIAYSGKKLQIGASVSQLIQSKLGFYNGNLSSGEEGRLYRHYYLHGGYKIKMDDATTITPNFLLIYLPNAPEEFQVGARVEHNEVFWWGIGYRINQSFLLSAGVNISKKFTVGYAFDIYNTPYSIYEKGSNSHEILLRYNVWK